MVGAVLEPPRSACGAPPNRPPRNPPDDPCEVPWSVPVPWTPVVPWVAPWLPWPPALNRVPLSSACDVFVVAACWTLWLSGC